MTGECERDDGEEGARGREGREGEGKEGEREKGRRERGRREGECLLTSCFSLPP